MRSLLGLVDSDFEGRLLELEGLCVVREYLVLRAALRALIRLREKLPVDQAYTELESLLVEAVRGAELDLDKYGIYLSDNTAHLTLEVDHRLQRHKEHMLEKEIQHS